MPKQIIYKQEAQTKLKKGVDAVANAVGATMGPLGRNVGLEKTWGAPTVTHDGVTVAKEIELKDKFENIGAKLVLEAATKTNDVAGDGTTTAILIAQALVESGLKNVAAGANPMFVRRGLEKAVKEVTAKIKEMAKDIKVDERTQVATNSAQDPQIGKIIADAMQKVGPDGVITIEEGRSLEMELETKEGMNFDNGYLSAYFVTDPDKMVAEIEDAHILITDKKISTLQDLVPMLENLVKLTQNLVIIAEDIEGQALATLVVNKLRGSLKVLAVKAPGFGDRRKSMLEDIAAVTGGQLISDDVGRKLDSVTIEDLGRADKVISTKDDTTIVGGKGNKELIKARENQIRKEMDESTSDYDKEKLQERLAKLIGGVAIISVGAATEAEMKEKKYRVEDAVNATQAAVAEGIVPGGGVAFLKARRVLNSLKLDKEEQVGVEILHEALEKPFRKLAENAGLEPGMYIKEIEDNLSKNIGLNVMTGVLENMLEAGIIDPAKVTRSAVENAVSVAISIITTDALIADEPQPEKPEPGAGGGMPGGMGGMM
ncbi:chaperonin GroL [candidate division WWE3 bacterium RIFCSPLOWO2_01_FULL_39_13]|uniref:Chaperonin GroEL n=1 Tax=candidate division WWE3 bacterium RIFCSPLOWO2_01_FULL_39_13 TaxID=1802624 RepID=A0A1F4V3A7_UNCKA|nr:MAG: chaperonin GroL [candidate division WWE3 bacterium RIFCSPLOWO2_01_FULL_39_13]